MLSFGLFSPYSPLHPFTIIDLTVENLSASVGEFPTGTQRRNRFSLFSDSAFRVRLVRCPTRDRCLLILQSISAQHLATLASVGDS